MYTGLDPFGTKTKWVTIRVVFTPDLTDPVRVRSAIWYQTDPLTKVIQKGTVLTQFGTGSMQTRAHLLAFC